LTKTVVDQTIQTTERDRTVPISLTWPEQSSGIQFRLPDRTVTELSSEDYHVLGMDEFSAGAIGWSPAKPRM
jgi:hypothetical protein